MTGPDIPDTVVFDPDDEADIVARAMAPNLFRAWDDTYRTAMNRGLPEAEARSLADRRYGTNVTVARAKAVSGIDSLAMRRALVAGSVSSASRQALLDEVRGHRSDIAAGTLGPLDAVARDLGMLIDLVQAESAGISASSDGLAETAQALADDRERMARRIGALAEFQRAVPGREAVTVGLKTVALALLADAPREDG